MFFLWCHVSCYVRTCLRAAYHWEVTHSGELHILSCCLVFLYCTWWIINVILFTNIEGIYTTYLTVHVHTSMVMSYCTCTCTSIHYKVNILLTVTNPPLSPINTLVRPPEAKIQWCSGWESSEITKEEQNSKCEAFVWLNELLFAPQHVSPVCNNYPRRAWAATGIVVCLFVCLIFSICSPGCHSTAFAALIASTQQVITFKSWC